MRRGVVFAIVAFSFCIVSYARAQSDTIVLAENGAANAVILVAPDAPEPVRHAANELGGFLSQITGAEFERVESLPQSQTIIAVGPGAAQLVQPAFSADDLDQEEIIIRAVDSKNLVLAGGEPRGALYAVYTFLEDHVGCRWWTPQASTIPSRPTLTVSNDIDAQYAPPLEYRYPFWSVAFDADWLARNKSNGHWGGSGNIDREQELLKRYGGYMSHGGVHTFYRLIPPKQYFEAHPEWFSEIEGTRKWEHAQLCLSNDEMRAELTKNLRRQINRRPVPPVFSVSQNDWFGYCTCEKCQSLANKYGGQSGLMVHFVNQVAEEVEKTHPDAILSTLAYQYTRKPPQNVRPKPNVVIQLCSIECSFAVPLTHERNATFRDDIIGWSKIADRLYIWDYTGNFRHYFMPHPNLRVLGPNIRFFVDHHAKGIFEQGAYNSLGAEFAELRCWVMAKLLWDPSRDDQSLIREFCDGYYGPAAPHILKYIDVIHEAAASQEEYAHCLPTYDYKFPFLSFEVLASAWQHMQDARDAVSSEPEYLSRVELAQLWPLYAFMWRWEELTTEAAEAGADWPLDDDIRQVAAHVKNVASQQGVTRLKEWERGFGLIDRCVNQVIEE